MQKAVMVVDAPDNCLRCQFCIRDKEYPQCKLSKAIGGSYNTIWEKLDTTPDWCPLVVIPNRRDDCHGYNKGWNDLIDSIVKR